MLKSVFYKKRKLKKTKTLLISCIILGIGLGVFLYEGTFTKHNILNDLLMKELVRFRPVPVVTYNSSDFNNVIYVLGGSPQSLTGRFKTAADLYQAGIARRILIDGNEAMMEYSPSLGRNLTFNEWAVNSLVGLGVNEQDIEPVSIENGFFGTYSEARGIAHIVFERDFETLILVSSHYHTMRVWETFSRFVENGNLHLYVYASKDHPGIFDLLYEYFKLNFYRLFLL